MMTPNINFFILTVYRIPTDMNTHYTYIEDISHPQHNLLGLNEIPLLLLLSQNPHILLDKDHRNTPQYLYSYIGDKNLHFYYLGQKAQASSDRYRPRPE